MQDMNFTVNRGDTVGIIGGTGSGKTSLVNLIPGFYPATEGEILLEGRDIRTMSDEELRGRIGVVPQKAVLFKGTIRSNLQWGKPDATEEEMWKALELAQASEVVDGKPGKLDATVAQNGKNFSGGQRQRLTIARALVRNPEILILDDSAPHWTTQRMQNSVQQSGLWKIRPQPLSYPSAPPRSAMRTRSSYWMTVRSQVWEPMMNC